MDRYTRGVMANVKIEKPVRQVVEQIIAEGVPHHYSLVPEVAELYAKRAAELKEICGLLQIPVIEA